MLRQITTPGSRWQPLRPPGSLAACPEVADVAVDDRGWPTVVMRGGNVAQSTGRWHLSHGLGRVAARGEAFGLVFDLEDAAPGAGALVEAALARRRPIRAFCVGAATVIRHGGRTSRRLADHPVLFPFPSVAVASIEEGQAWVRDRFARA